MKNKNFEKEVLRRKKPDCYGKFEATIKDKPGKLKCGTCWFKPFCSGAEKLPTKKEEKATDKKSDK